MYQPFKGHQEEKHSRVLICSLHHCTAKLSHLQKVWMAGQELRMGKLPCGHHQWFRDSFRAFLHAHIFPKSCWQPLRDLPNSVVLQVQKMRNHGRTRQMGSRKE
ncbi:hypothetical protein DKX38_021910 [Salix brachista]|uniref:Uncharacterized protein n=1 Tax=Salix brachista TaxID=2182728 RepID=A0A5N5JY84_9ROSI|nr:hypothetical protein DKX38_021910 [Salix brachista]